MSAPLLVAPSPDPRVGLKAGLQDAGEAIWNMRKISSTQSPQGFAGITNSDLGFSGTNVIQGNYNGFEIWDISNPRAPRIRVAKICPASQSDVSVYKHLLFVSAEAPTARLDCGKDAPRETVSRDRVRGLRIFDITNIDEPKYLTNVQTCRGSHTHTVVHDPRDDKNIYVYISGTSGIRPSEELARCNDNPWDPNNSNFRIEVIKIPLAHPEQADVVSSPAIFADPTNGVANGLLSPRAHGASPADTAANRIRALFDSARVRLAPVQPTPADTARCISQVDSLAKVFNVNLNAGRGGGRGGLPGGGCGRAAGGGRGGRGGGRGGADSLPVTHSDSMRVQFTRAVAALPQLRSTSSNADTTSYRKQVDALAKQYGVASPFAPRAITQCHDITVYPAVGLAGGACAGMGLLLDIHDTPNPRRIAAVADSNFSFWHSATFSNDGSKILFTDEWGGGSAPRCRTTDKYEWGADALFTLSNNQMTFKSYYKMPAAQTSTENCVAHNGSLIPIPGREVMVQGWYQGGISVFDWTDISHPKEIAYFDRGPLDPTRLVTAGSWSVYWYNGAIVSSEIQRGLDIFELLPSAFISKNELEAAKTVHFDYLNAQGQPKFIWPASFPVVRSYVDQLVRGNGMASDRLTSVSVELDRLEKLSGAERKAGLSALATQLHKDAVGAADSQRAHAMAAEVGRLAAAQP